MYICISLDGFSGHDLDLAIDCLHKILSNMRTIFNLFFGVIKFTFKDIFWFIGIIFMLVLGSCPD